MNDISGSMALFPTSHALRQIELTLGYTNNTSNMLASFLSSIVLSFIIISEILKLSFPSICEFKKSNMCRRPYILPSLRAASVISKVFFFTNSNKLGSGITPFFSHRVK